MKTSILRACAALCLVMGFASTGAARAAVACLSTCTEHNNTCLASGRAEASCLSRWHQCKVTCAQPAHAVRTSAAPASPRIMAAAGAPQMVKASAIQH